MVSVVHTAITGRRYRVNESVSEGDMDKVTGGCEQSPAIITIKSHIMDK